MNIYWRIIEGKAVALIPKSASSSIARVRGKDASVQYALIHTDRIAWVRNYFERFLSGFYFFHDMTKQAVIDGVRPHHARTYENYVDHTFETDNNHWIPQSELLTYNGCYVPTKTYRFDDLADTWPFASELKKLNVSKRFQVDETYRRGEIDAKYKPDHKLWLSAEHLTL